MRAHAGGALILVAFALSEACSGGTTTRHGTAWSDPCSSDTECGSGSCVCGRCTLSCTEDSACKDIGGSAICVTLRGSGATCEGRAPPPGVNGICGVPCNADADCGASGACRGGLCESATAASHPTADAGTLVGAARDASAPSPLVDAARPDPSAFADVNVPVDFTDPVTLPLPDPAFSGDASSLVGSWVELAFDGQPCTQQNIGPDLAGSVCTHLDIVAAPGGGYSGTLYREISTQNTPPVTGPFAPPSDPTIGYPAELSPEQYGYARDFVPGVRYRAFDGLVRNGELTFWVSPLDVWTDWCNLQTPFLWDVGGRHRYRCVPQTASETDTDLGKLALCTSAEELPYCADAEGNSFPCACLDSTAQFNSGMPLCSLTYCECSASECHADMRGTSITTSLKLAGDTLVGVINLDPHFSQTTTLKKVSP